MKRRGRPRYPDILTPRQREVWELVYQGLSNEQIAEKLGISLDGAKYHVSEVLRRLGVESRYDAANWSPGADAAPASRWAWLAAPLFLTKKVKLVALWYIASGVAISAVAVGGALLAWGVLRDHREPPKGAVVETTRTPVPRTNIPELDRVIDLLVHQDVDGLIQVVSFHAVPCGESRTVGGQPPCAPGTPEGSPVDGFPVGACEGGDLSIDQLRPAFGDVLLHQRSAAVYAVIRTNPAGAAPTYDVVMTEDRPSAATADASFWKVDASGHITGLQSPCGGGAGAAQQVAYRYPNADFVLGPYNSCLERPGETANLMLTVEGFSQGGIRPQFWGPARTTVGTDTGGRAIVTVSADTAWTTGGGISRLEDVRAGMELEAVGPMGEDCVITAQTILAPITAGTPVVGPTP